LQTIADEGPYPSIVAGAVPFGAPVTVSWAEAGVAATRAQKAAVDRADIKMFFIESSIGLRDSLSVCKGSCGDVSWITFSNPLHECAACP
jgi:hypothetical protein